MPDPVAWRRYLRGELKDDLIAACVVAVLLVPQSLAYALLAGLPPQAGLYASLLPLVAYAVLGSSPVVAVGPVAAVSLMVAQAVAAAPAGVSAHEVALVIAAEVGVVLALAAWWRLHALAALLSVPVLQGFETGAALTIVFSQLPELVGSSARGSSLPALLSSWREAEIAWWPATLAFGLGAAALLWLVRRHGVALLCRVLPRAMPRERAVLFTRLAPLVVLGLAVAAAVLVDAGGRGVAVVGALPGLDTAWVLPSADLSLWMHLLPTSLLIALVSFVSTLVVAESLARRDGSRVLPRRELAGLAAANLVASASAGMPVAGSFTRSVVVMDAGARTRMAGVFTAVLMAVALAAVARPLAMLPVAALAATIIVASMSVLDVGPFREAWRYDRAEFGLMVAVGLLTLFVGLAPAIGLGVAGSIALLLQRTARPHVALVGRIPGTEHYRNVGRHEVELVPGVMGLRIDESLLFTNARQLGDVVEQHLASYPDTTRVVLQMSPVNRIDFSGLAALRALHDLLAARGIRLDLSEVKGPVLDALGTGGWDRWFAGQVFMSHHQAMMVEPPMR